MVATAKGQPQLMINPMANKHNPVPVGAFNQHISRSVPQASALGWEGGSFPRGGLPWGCRVGPAPEPTKQTRAGLGSALILLYEP